VDHASKVFNNLSQEDVEALTIAMAKLKDITSETVNEVIKEYYDMMVAKNYVEEGGMGYASKVLESALGKEQAEALVRRINASKELQDMTGGFDLLEKVEENQLINFLQNEHPQTAALIMANLESGQAASILSNFPSESQGEIAYRLAIMEKTSPELIQDIEEVLTEQLGSTFGGSLSKAGGTEAVAGILNSVGKKGEESVMNFIDEKNATLANEIKALMFVFDDIFNLPDDTIGSIFKSAIEHEDIGMDGIARSIKPLTADQREKTFLEIGGKQLKMLKDTIEELPLLRASEVQEAQAAIVDLVRQLEEDGTIVLIGSDEEMI
tara:strand:- start:1537 stop:2508 length:972 start_codon:yes stop_codon:yes gene_type:complete